MGQAGRTMSRELCVASKTQTHIGRKWKEQVGMDGYEKAQGSSTSGSSS